MFQADGTVCASYLGEALAGPGAWAFPVGFSLPLRSATSPGSSYDPSARPDPAARPPPFSSLNLLHGSFILSSPEASARPVSVRDQRGPPG